MSERINTPFTNEHFIAFCEKMLGQPYWYGTCLYKCKTSLLNSKSKQYPNNYSASRRKKFEKDIADKKVAADCIGGCKGYAWTNGGQGVIESIGTDATYTSKYGSNGCPDKGANGMFTYAKNKGMKWGTIATLPEIAGLALYKKGHAGYYAGNGNAIEWKGTDYGCVKTKVQGRGWTYWYMLPFIDYGEGSTDVLAPVPETKPPALGDRLLMNGSKGEDVKDLQSALLSLGLQQAIHAAIEQNARVAQDQNAYQERFDELSHRYDETKAQHDAIDKQIAEKASTKSAAQHIIDTLQKQKELITEFDPNLWGSLVDHLTVFSKEDVCCTFKDGTEIKL